MTTLLVLAGVAGSMLAAHLLAQSDRQRAHSAFTASAASAASALTQAIQHEEDLVVSARAFISANPSASQAAFIHWTAVVEAFKRYPEVEGGGEVAIVPAQQLAAFAERQTIEPASPLPAGGAYEVLPSGRRPFYCLLALEFARTPQATAVVTTGLDYCAVKTTLRTALFAARDSGQNSYLPNRTGSRTELLIETPVYRSGVVPRTIAGRRRALIGAFATSVNPGVLLAAALRGHPDVAVEFRYDGGQSNAVFRSAPAVPGGQSATIDLGGSWSMRASGAALAGGLLADGNAQLLLAGGIALSLLLGLLLFVLGTGRARAFALVSEKTTEISYQAVHDSLTGLPNRTLVLDRAERMLSRARRDPASWSRRCTWTSIASSTSTTASAMPPATTS